MRRKDKDTFKQVFNRRGARHLRLLHFYLLVIQCEELAHYVCVCVDEELARVVGFVRYVCLCSSVVTLLHLRHLVVCC